MRLPSEDRYTIITTISRVEAKKILNMKAEQGWKLAGFGTRENELVMVFERTCVDEEYLHVSDRRQAKEKRAAKRRRKWLGLERLLRGERNV